MKAPPIGTPEAHPKMRPVPKPEKPARDPVYLDWIRSVVCLVHGRSCTGGMIEAAHTDGGGATGRKGSDHLTVPLCHGAHIGELHQWGEVTFELHYNVDLRAEARALRRLYIGGMS